MPLELPTAFAFVARDSEPIVTFADWAVHLADVATAPLTYQHIEIDCSVSENGRVYFTKAGMPIDIDDVSANNRAHANRVKALHLYNAALTPWYAQPKKRRAVVARPANQKAQ